MCFLFIGHFEFCSQLERDLGPRKLGGLGQSDIPKILGTSDFLPKSNTPLSDTSDI